MKTIITIHFTIFIFLNLHAQDYPINLKETSGYFEEIKKICDFDNGKLWGENLWAPILLIDKNSRFMVANQADKENMLKKTDNVYTGYFPKDKVIANSTTDFGKESWMMVMYPLPENDYRRNQLCIHELFHRLQNKSSLNFGGYDNSHMDNMDARVLLKLEWSALIMAVKVENKKRKEYLTDALVFRNYRRMLYPGKDTMENKFEIQEGLAEYTGHKICSNNNEEFKNNVLNGKDKNWNNETFVRSFAYYSGLLYGYILDQGKLDWIHHINVRSDLGSMVQNSYHIKIPDNLKKYYEESKKIYNYEEILQFESKREEKRQKTLAMYRNKFTKDTILILSTPRPNVGFDPRNLIPLDSLGTVYPTIKIIADWGILQVNSGGCLFDWKKAIISGRKIKQEKNKLIGDGWELELNEHWVLIKESMNYKLENSE